MENVFFFPVFSRNEIISRCCESPWLFHSISFAWFSAFLRSIHASELFPFPIVLPSFVTRKCAMFSTSLPERHKHTSKIIVEMKWLSFLFASYILRTAGRSLHVCRTAVETVRNCLNRVEEEKLFSSIPWRINRSSQDIDFVILASFGYYKA